MNLNNFYSGWKNLIFKDKEVEKIALPRLEICAKCPFMKNEIIPKCGKCSCPLSSKTRALYSQCPDKRW